MKKKKLTLEVLSVDSFVTKFGKEEENTLKGGATTPVCTDSDPADTDGNICTYGGCVG